MKKSSFVSLVLVTSLFHACGPSPSRDDEKLNASRSRLYARTDSVAMYSRIEKDNTKWGDYSQYYYFEPYGHYDEITKHYVRSGYHSFGLHHTSSSYHTYSHSSSGKSSGSYSRGGFGRSSKVSS